MLKFVTCLLILQIQASLLYASLAICKGLFSLPLWCLWWDTHSIADVHGPIGMHLRHPHWCMDRFPDGVCNHILLILSKPCLLFFLLFPESQSHGSGQYPGCCEKEMDFFFSCIPNSWKNQSLTYWLLLFLWERSWTKKFSLGTELCYSLEGEVMWVMWNCFSYIFSLWNLWFVGSNGLLELLYWKPGLPQNLSHSWRIFIIGIIWWGRDDSRKLF